MVKLTRTMEAVESHYITTDEETKAQRLREKRVLGLLRNLHFATLYSIQHLDNPPLSDKLQCGQVFGQHKKM